MESTIKQVRKHLDALLSHLTPLLPMSNCHMVEFITHNHWDTYLPGPLRNVLESWTLEEAAGKFWSAAENSSMNDSCPLAKWLTASQSSYLVANNTYCLSVDQLKHKIKKWGGEIQAEIKIKEFMNSKKSYEVQTLSQLVASLHQACGADCCVEAGGGKGHMPVALTLGYGVPSLTVDCDADVIEHAEKRVQIIQKQWRAIAKKITNSKEENISDNNNRGLHRFAQAYITTNTDLQGIVKETFPEIQKENVKLLLTGLHTCGNLGPDSLRIFHHQPSVAAVLNVPCCYHLLTEQVDHQLYDVFQKGYGGDEKNEGFPMSQHLKGYNLGRNARMLAAQSIHRVVHEKQLPAKSLYYRALLQVLIKKHKPDLSLAEGRLKKLSNCDNFIQYCQAADRMLNLDLFDGLSTADIDRLQEEFSGEWKKLAMFYLLRLTLAQVIESVILLDRLLFLLEIGYEEVYLVKLFDPVMSPRCHGILCIR